MLNSVLSLRSQPRRVAGIAAGVLAFVYCYSQANDGNHFLRFTILGISAGCVYAIAASGIVITYTTTGVFNFAHGAVGMICAYLYYSFRVQIGLPTPIALILVLGVIAPLIGLILELVMRRFKDAGAGATLTVTIALTILLIGVAQFAYGAEGRQIPKLLGDGQLSVFGANITYDDALFLVIAIAVAVGLRILLFTSRMGVAMRAVVDNPTLAALNGAPPTTIARYSWMLGSFLAALAGVLFAPSQTPLEAIVLTFFVLNAYGAAVFGKLKSLPLTFVAAMLLGLARSYASFALPSGAFWSHVNLSLAAIVLFVALLVLPDAKLTVGRIVGRTAPAVPGLVSSLARSGVFVGVVVLLSLMGPAAYLADMTRGLIYGVILLSLVVLTGFSGQISLCQYVFVALGAWAMGKIAGGDNLLGMVGGTLVAVPVGVLIALPAMRLQGLYLALVTFGFAAVSRDLIFEDRIFFGESNVSVGRLDLLGVDFSGGRPFMVLCGITFAAVGLGVLALKRGPFGRRLAAMRDSQAACATLGLDVRRTKLVVFALSAAIAGLAGTLFGGLQATVGSIDFDPINNVVLFLFAVVGGITTVTGAFIGGALFALLPLVLSKWPDLAGLVFAAVAVGAISLGRQPNGLAGMLYERLPSLGTRRTSAARPVPTPEKVPAGAPA